MTSMLELEHVGKRYGRAWALQDCTCAIEPGRIVALVGPNGAGKTTLLHLATGLSEPTTGAVRLDGVAPIHPRIQRENVLGFVAQDHLLYKQFTVDEMVQAAKGLNRTWDEAFARHHLTRLEIPFKRRVGQLSGGQQAQLALVLALAKRPRVLVLDEPLASLDPLARRQFLSLLLDVATESGLTVILSSHIISDLERVCDTLLLLAHGHMQLCEDMDALRATHKRLISNKLPIAPLAAHHEIISELHGDHQTAVIARLDGPLFATGWEMQDLPLEEIVLAYLERAQTASSAAPLREPSQPPLQPSLQEVR